MNSSLVRFLLLTVAYSVGIFALGRWAFSSGIYESSMSGYVASVLAIMLAAQGVPLRRRLIFVGVTAGVFVAVDLIALLAGVQVASLESVGAGTEVNLLGAVYQGFVRVFPIVALALFVGRRPQSLWRWQG